MHILTLDTYVFGGKMKKQDNNKTKKVLKGTLTGALVCGAMFGGMTMMTGCDMLGGGEDKDPISISEDGYWVIDGEKTEYKAEANEATTVTGISVESEEGDRWGIKTRIKVTLSNGEAIYSNWTTNILANTSYDIETEAELMNLIGQGVENIKLDKDITLTSETTLALTNDLSLDLGGHTLTIESTDPIDIENGIMVEFCNGQIEMTSTSTITATMRVFSGSTLKLCNVEYTSTGTALMAYGDAARLEVVDSIVTGATYAVATNAATDENYGVSIDLRDSEFYTTGDMPAGATVTNYDDTAILINIPCDVNVDGCDIYGDRQAMIVRGGDVMIRDSRLVLSGKYADATKYLNSSWGNGNEVPMASLVVGDNYANGYAYEVNCNVIDTDIISKKLDAPAIYAYGDADEQDVVIVLSGDMTELGEIVVKGNVDINYEINTFAELDSILDMVSTQNTNGVGAKVVLTQDIASEEGTLEQTGIDRYNNFITNYVDKGDYNVNLRYTPAVSPSSYSNM